MKSRTAFAGARALLQPILALVGMASAFSQSIVQEYYVPMPEAQIRQSFLALASNTGTTMDTTISMVAAVNGTKIVYDHWEDGYEVNLDSPTQASTQIWGDGNDSNGKPPGFATDPNGLSAGAVIALRNLITLPRNPTAFLYDGRDRVGATRGIAVSRSSWATTPGAVLADATEVNATIDWGTNFTIPVGENEIFPTPATASMFELCSLFVQASQAGTTVRIDRDGNGTVDATVVLGQGETYYLERGVLRGATVLATKPVQTHIITGDIGGNYETRWYTVAPTNLWGSRYYSPVGTASDGDDTYVFLYNPDTEATTVAVTTRLGTSTISIPPKSNYIYLMPQESGASFINAAGKTFYAIATVGAEPTANNVHDWGFSLVQESDLTTSLSLGWGPGSSETGTITVNGNPVWVTATKNTTLYVDFNGDRIGSQTDPLGGKCDQILQVSALQVVRLFDPDKDQTGMRVYTTDGTLITGAWGQDPATAGPGNPFLDAGTTIPSFPLPVIRKTSAIAVDNNTVGLSDGDVLEYTITLDNAGLVALGNTLVTDNPPSKLIYVAGSATRDGVTVPDNTGAGNTPFPFDAGGYNIPILARGQVTTLKYRATISGTGPITNTVTTSYPGVVSTNTISVPGGGTAAQITFSLSGGTGTTTYTAGDGIYVTLTDPDANTNSTTVQTVTVIVRNPTTGDYETITLTETTASSGVFRNTTPLPSSSAAGTKPNDGTLNVFPGNGLTVSYTDPVFGETANATATIITPAPAKILYLSTDGVGNPDQDLDRIDPNLSGDTTPAFTADITVPSAVTAGTTSQLGFNGPLLGTTPSATMSHTVSGTNRLLLLSVNYEDDNTAGMAINTVTFNNVAMTRVSRVPSSQEAVSELWMLMNPPATTANIVVNMTDFSIGDALYLAATTFTGVNQTTPLGTTVTAIGTTTPTTITAGGAVGELVYVTAAIDDSRTATPTGATATALWNGAIGGTGDGIRSVGSTRAGTGSTAAFAWTLSAADTWAAIAVPIRQATAGIASTVSFTQTPNFAEAFTIPSGSQLVGTIFYTASTGTLSGTVAVSATLRYGSTVVATASSASANASTSVLTFNFPALSSAVTIPAGQPLTLDITTAVSGVSFRVDYDLNTKPSRISIPTTTVIHTDSVGVYTAPYPGGTLVTSPSNGQTLYVRTVVGDPFGAYDITSVSLNVDARDSNIDDFTVVLNDANVVASTASSKTYEYVWRTGVTTGPYTLAATAREGLEGTITSSRATSVTLSFQDLGTPSTTEFLNASGTRTTTYAANDPVRIRVTDLDKNQNPNLAETITVIVTNSSGDSETVTLVETGVNTGVFAAVLPTTSTGSPTQNNGTLYAPTGSVINVVYTDATDSNDTSSATATVPAATATPALSMSKTLISPTGGQAMVGDTIQYRLRVVNTGGTALSTVSLTDTFPVANLTYVSATTTPTSVSGGTITWSNVGPLALGESAEIFLTFTANAAGTTVTNSATATSGSATSTSSANITIVRPRLTVTKTVTSPTSGVAGRGDNVVFNISVQNSGTTAIPNLPLEDLFSNDTFEYVTASLTPNAVGSGTILWNDITGPGSLAVGATQTISVTLRVKGQANPATNVAAVNYATDANGNAVPASSSTASLVTSAASIRGTVFEDKGTAGFGDGDTPLANVRVTLYSDPNNDGDPSDGTVLAIANTGTDGVYEFLNLAIGNYVVVETDPIGYRSVADVDGANDNRIKVSITTLTAVTGRNFLDIYINPQDYANIAGQVRNDVDGDGDLLDADSGISGVTIDLYTDPNGDGDPTDGTLYLSVLTNSTGNYNFDLVPPGSYVVIETDLAGYFSTNDKTLPNDNRIPVTVAANGNSLDNHFLDSNATTLLGTIGDLVWADANNNGRFDAGESGIPNVIVQLYRTSQTPGSSVPYRTTTTNSSGIYAFAGVPAGNYLIYLPVSNFSGSGALVTSPLSSTLTVTLDNRVNNDDNGIQTASGAAVVSPAISISPNETDNTIDFGFVPNASLGNISGTVLADINNDNIGDTGIGGVTIQLFTDPNGDGNPADGVVVATTTTAANGSYSFTGLPPRAYVVIESQPAGGYLFVSDSDSSTPARQVALVLAAGGSGVANFVEELPGTVTGRIYRDVNGNGTQQLPAEQGIPDIRVVISNANGGTQEVFTDSDGNWSATVPPGTTIANVDEFYLPEGWVQTEGTDPTTVTVSAGGSVSAGNDGYFYPAIVTGRVYRDVLGNGVQDGSDPGISGVIVRVRDVLGVIRNVTTNANGDWTVSVPPGATVIDVLELDATFPTGGILVEGTDPNTVDAQPGTTTNGGRDGYYFPATVTGHVYLDVNGNSVQDSGEPNLPNVGILVTGSNGVAQTVNTDNAGNWLASVTPGGGTAKVVTTSPGFPAGAVQRQGDDPTSFVAVAAQVVSGGIDGYFVPATVTGYIYRDVNGNGVQDSGEAGLAGVPVKITNSLGAVQTVTTDALGFWTATVPPGTTIADIDDASPAIPSGSVRTQGTDPTTVTALAGATADAGKDGYYQAATVTGHLYVDSNGNGVEDAGDQPLPNVNVIITDILGVVRVVVTDANGNWTVSVPPGQTTVDVDQADPDFPAGGTLSQGTDPSTVTAVAGQSTAAGTIGYRILGIVTGHLYIDVNDSGAQDPGEPDLAGVTVTVSGGPSGTVTTETDSQGNWSVSVAPGNYQAKVDTLDPQFPAGSVQREGTDPTPVTALAGQTVSAGNDGYYIATSVTGTIYLDRNNNGTRDNGEPGLADVTVQVTASNNSVRTVVTDANGVWVASVPPGTTTSVVQETSPIFTAGYVRTQGTGTGTVSAVNGSPTSVPINGYYFPATITGHLFNDLNGNGIEDSGEPGLGGVTIIITDSLGVVRTVETDVNGNWTASVPPGQTTVDIDNSDPQIPSGATQTAGNDPVTVTAVAGVSTPSGSTAGFYKSATVTGHLYLDTNGNGTQDIGEPNLPGVNVFVADSNNVTRTVVTDENGNWTASVPPGQTLIDIDETDPQFPAGSTQTQGVALTTVTATTANPVSAGAAGFFVPAVITGHLYLDLNGNGNQDFVVHDLANVNIIVTDSNGQTQIVVTDSNGNWRATVPPGPASAKVDDTDPEYPAGSTITQGAATTVFNAIAGATTGSTPVGFFFPARVFGHLYIDTNGNGVQDTGEPDLAGVDIFVTSAINNVQTVTTDANGDWIATVPPGNTKIDINENDPDYPTGYTQTEGTDPSFVTAVGSIDTFAGNDGFYRSGTISGGIFNDTNGNGTRDPGETGLPGVDVLITDVNGNTQTVTTGANGEWVATVPPGRVDIDIVDTDPQIPAGATKTTGDDPTFVIAQPGVNVPVPGTVGFFQAATVTGVLYADTNGNGVRDAGEQGLPDITVLITDSLNAARTAVTDANGVWTVSVPPGTTVAKVDTLDPQFPAGVIQREGTDPTTVTAVAGTTVSAGNDGYFLPAQLTGTIYRDVNGNATRDGGENGLAGVIVRITDSLGTVRDVVTNAAGVWTVSVPPGETVVDILNQDGTFPTGGVLRQGVDPQTVVAVAGSTVTAGTAGYYFPATVTGHVYFDVNGNGTQDSGESGIASLDVVITDSNGTTQTVITDGNGNWTASVPPGSTSAKLLESDPQFPTGAQRTSGADPSVASAVATQITGTAPIGYYFPATITGVVYADTNGNGSQQAGEDGYVGVTVNITDSQGATQTVTTGAGGVWTASVPPGLATVLVTDTAAVIPATSILREGTNPSTVAAVAGVVSNAGKDGYFLPAILTGHLWVDADGSGTEDPGEALPNVNIIITDSNGTVIIVTTDANGDWTVTVPPGTTIVDVDQGDPDFPIGGTLVGGGTDPSTVTAVAGSTVATPGLSYRVFGVLTGHLYYDVNDNGVQDPGEPAMAGITITILDSLGDLQVLETDVDGNWRANVPPGTTRVTVETSDPQFPSGAEQTQGTNPTDVVAIAGQSVSGGVNGYYVATSVTGIVYLDRNNNGTRDAGEPGLAGVIVRVTDSNNVPRNVVTDSEGVWVASVPVGTTTSVVQESGTIFTPGYDRTEGTGTSTVTAVNGSPTQVDITGYYFPGALTGIIFDDTNGNGVQDGAEQGIPGVQVTITAGNGVVTVVTTNANGEWTAEVGPGTAIVSVDRGDVPPGAIVTAGSDPTEVTVTPGTTTTVPGTAFYVPATVGGHLFRDVNGNGVQDPGEPNLPNVNVFVATSTGTVITVVTDANGDWTASVPPGTTLIDIDENDPDFPAGGVLTAGQPVTTVTAVAGQNTSGGTLAYFVPATIRGHLYLDVNGNGTQQVATEANLANLDLLIVIVDSNGNTTRVTTDSAGNWSATVPPGPATATVDSADPEYPAGALVTQGAITTSFNAVAGASTDSTPVGFFYPAIITGHLYEDVNGNGTQDPGEPNLPNINLSVLNSNNITLTVTTDVNGNWSASVPPGTTVVNVDESDPDFPSTHVQTEGDDPTTVTAVANTTTFAGRDGYYRAGTVSGRVYADTNGDGDLDSGENGIAGVEVRITTSTGTVLTVFTDAVGFWTSPVPPGSTIVDVIDTSSVIPAGSVRTAGTDTVTVTATAGANVSAGSTGYFLPGTISGFVQSDTDGNGIPDTGIAGVTVGLFDTSSNAIASTVTAANGSYSFTNLPPGSYVIVELQPAGYLSISDVDGGDPDTIGDVSPVVLAAGGTVSGRNFLERPLKTPNTFAAWQAANPLGGQNGPTQNPDGDISNNLIEYAFGLDPASGAGNPYCLVPSLANDGTIDAVYTRTAGGALDVTYELQSISSLTLSPASWATVSLAPVNFTVTNNGDGSETVRILNLQALTGYTTGGFVRMRVSLDADSNGTPEAVAVTEVGGWVATDLGEGCRTYADPFVSCPPFSGVVSGVNGQQITLGTSAAGLNLATVLPSGSSYYLEVTSGDWAGHRFDVTTTGVGTLSLANDSDIYSETGPFNTVAGALPASLVGDSFVIRVHRSLGQMFPVTAFAATNSQDTADQVQTYSNGVFICYWLYNDGGTPRWVRVDDSSMSDQTSKVIPPTAGTFVTCVDGPGALLAYGKVRSNDFALPLQAGNNLVHGGYPVDESPLSRGMTLGNGFYGDRDFKKADEIFIWRGDQSSSASGYDTYYLLDASTTLRRWVKVGDATLQPQDGALLFKRDNSAFIKTNNPLPFHKVTRPWQP
ncbi:carboxypeptidase regulatory-like domain-containing protein [Luteolibacter flavescens]|uniref:Carboxypeptidase regulatory-like domain-containing protein n=1 Tax=Luteolibacter flavescens TaxID=1859460 RepID=A0ABT3FPP9_9BACT|nr:SdrD B-like domain-containing protein [Luteolibacter flavescens]MCW1885552.1 carboxypeptidase regulatory-like domain-containing protein [Luteolibacter flavescens]